jgi:hypothetical protein
MHSLYRTRNEQGKVDGRSHALLESGSRPRDHHVYLLVLYGYDDVPVLIVEIYPGADPLTCMPLQKSALGFVDTSIHGLTS